MRPCAASFPNILGHADRVLNHVDEDERLEDVGTALTEVNGTLGEVKGLLAVLEAEGGPSGIGNYGPMTRRHHRIKAHDHWDVRQAWPGIYLWRDLYGTHFLVDHTGTHRLNAA